LQETLGAINMPSVAAAVAATGMPPMPSINMGSMPSMSWKTQTKPSATVSPFLIVHFHGGGFIAQSSSSHEVYLRDWAKALDAPILSVDYDLAPEHPFPVAVCQAFYAYCWALEHAQQLGSSAQSVICAGDSAGGNLAAVVALRAIEEGIQPPCGVMMIYPALYLHMTPCASRVLSLMDPLLPLGTLQLCMNSYAQRFQAAHGEATALLHKHYTRTETRGGGAGPAAPKGGERAQGGGAAGGAGRGEEDREPFATDEGESQPQACQNGCDEDGEDAGATHWCCECQAAICQVCVMMHRRQKATRQHTLRALDTPAGDAKRMSAQTRRRLHHLSPLVAPAVLLEKFPFCCIMASELDPLLDDAIMFARRLKALGRDAHFRLKVAPLLPHGWLNMYFTGDSGYMTASAEATCWMKMMLQRGLAEHEEAEGRAVSGTWSMDSLRSPVALTSVKAESDREVWRGGAHEEGDPGSADNLWVPGDVNKSPGSEGSGWGGRVG
jgi:acetyl esterase/lipase